MISDGITLDQIQVFLTVADAGSFSAAARDLGRAQSAITYAIQRLEDQVGGPLFDRSAYRPTLTDAGRALLPRARRIAEEAAAFRMQARGMAGGLEPELSLVVDSMFPTPCFVEAMRAFQATFPTVQTRIYVESLGATSQMVLDGAATLGLAVALGSESEQLRRIPVAIVELAIVAAPDHPLAKLGRVLTPDDMKDHTQLVLTDRSQLTAGKDHGVYATQTWRLADLGAKHALLLAGLGWGSMPAHMVADDLAAGRLVKLEATEWDGSRAIVTIGAHVIHRTDTVLGPAGQWMVQKLAQIPNLTPANAPPAAPA